MVFDVYCIAVAPHAPACPLYAVPPAAGGEVTAFLSSVTWSLLGVLTDVPILSEEARMNGFTNEGGAEGKICFLQNITGLWILQKLMGEWAEAGQCTDYDVLIPAAEEAQFASVINVDDAQFTSPVNMADAIVAYCRKSGQQAPRTQGEFVKCVLLSLAERYKKGIEGLNRLLPRPVTRLQIIGGGSQNKYLNRLTAQATGLQGAAGPVAATAIGNIRAPMPTVTRTRTPLIY